MSSTIPAEVLRQVATLLAPYLPQGSSPSTAASGAEVPDEFHRYLSEQLQTRLPEPLSPRKDQLVDLYRLTGGDLALIEGVIRRMETSKTPIQRPLAFMFAVLRRVDHDELRREGQQAEPRTAVAEALARTKARLSEQGLALPDDLEALV